MSPSWTHAVKVFLLRGQGSDDQLKGKVEAEKVVKDLPATPYAPESKLGPGISFRRLVWKYIVHAISCSLKSLDLQVLVDDFATADIAHPPMVEANRMPGRARPHPAWLQLHYDPRRRLGPAQAKGWRGSLHVQTGNLQLAPLASSQANTFLIIPIIFAHSSWTSRDGENLHKRLPSNMHKDHKTFQLATGQWLLMLTNHVLGRETAHRKRTRKGC